MSYDDIQRYDSIRGEELNNSRSTTLSTKKFSMYTGLSPKEKIEYHDYNDLRWENTYMEYTEDKKLFLSFILNTSYIVQIYFVIDSSAGPDLKICLYVDYHDCPSYG